MKFFSVHRDEDKLVLVREGFSWAAAVFNFAWALYHRAWTIAGLLIAVTYPAHMWLAHQDSGLKTAGMIAFGGVVGFVANDLRRWWLGLMKYEKLGVVSGLNKQDAERRFLDNNPKEVRAEQT